MLQGLNNYLFSASTVPKKMDSMSSCDIQYKPIPTNNTLKDEKKIINLINILCNNIRLKESIIPFNTWIIDQYGLTLHYYNENKKIHTIAAAKENDNTIEYILDNGVHLKLSYEDNKIYIYYINTKIKVVFDKWEVIES